MAFAHGDPARLRDCLEELYRTYTSSAWLSPDPVAFLHRYVNVRDREIVGLVASSLAYGRAAQISGSVARVLDVLGASPYETVVVHDDNHWLQVLGDFRHRFTSAEEVAALLAAVGRTIRRWGTIENVLADGCPGGNDTISAASLFVERLREEGASSAPTLLSSPRQGSACKRLFLFLKWMTRRDAVDPGGWTCLEPSHLIVPLDTHMYRICRAWEFTDRRSADLRAAVEATEAFRALAPKDPTRYDFALTRFGIRQELSLEMLCEKVKCLAQNENQGMKA